MMEISWALPTPSPPQKKIMASLKPRAPGGPQHPNSSGHTSEDYNNLDTFQTKSLIYCFKRFSYPIQSEYGDLLEWWGNGGAAVNGLDFPEHRGTGAPPGVTR